VALLINVFPVADIIHHEARAFQFKQHAVISGAQALFVLEAFQFFDVAGQVVLRAVKFCANQTACVLGQGAKLFQRGGNEINFVVHFYFWRRNLPQAASAAAKFGIAAGFCNMKSAASPFPSSKFHRSTS
jgi:hypothetical protein